MTEKTIDLRGLKCPLPALRARKALTGLEPGDTLIAECTDPLTAIDIPNLLNQTGDLLADRSDVKAHSPHAQNCRHKLLIAQPHRALLPQLFKGRLCGGIYLMVFTVDHQTKND